MIKKIVFLLVLLSSISQFGQQLNLQNYKYIVVADKFDFLKKSDEYQTSSLTKFLFNQKGFETYLSSEKLPEVLLNNRCNALFVAIKDNSNMFTTKNSVEVKDCNGKTVYTSGVGKSKLKDYKRAYQEAIRSAFNTMEDFEYSYNPSAGVKTENKKVITTNIDTETIKVIPKVVVKPAVKLENVKSLKKANTNLVDVLYAQPKNNGFQLVNTTPKVVFIILKTSIENLFIIDGKNGIFYKNENLWVAEHYENGEVTKKIYEVKF